MVGNIYIVGGEQIITGITTFQDDVTFTTANGNNIVFDKSDNSLQFGDNVAAKFGSGNDLNLFHTAV